MDMKDEIKIIANNMSANNIPFILVATHETLSTIELYTNKIHDLIRTGWEPVTASIALLQKWDYMTNEEKDKIAKPIMEALRNVNRRTQ